MSDLPDIVLDERALAKVGALAQLGEHGALPIAGLGDGDGALLHDVEALPALALPEDALPRPELYRLQRARDQLPVVLSRHGALLKAVTVAAVVEAVTMIVSLLTRECKLVFWALSQT